MTGFADLGAAQRAVQTLATSPTGARSTGVWSLAQVLNHAAQSVEYSMHGFPQLKPALFRATVGKIAFAVFQRRGRMSHPLDAPIPGAPALAAGDPVEPAATRLLDALRAFDGWTGPLAPHFAYGALDKAAFTRAHLMHLDDHWTEITTN